MPTKPSALGTGVGSHPSALSSILVLHVVHYEDESALIAASALSCKCTECKEAMGLESSQQTSERLVTCRLFAHLLVPSQHSSAQWTLVMECGYNGVHLDHSS